MQHAVGMAQLLPFNAPRLTHRLLHHIYVLLLQAQIEPMAGATSGGQ